MTLSLFGDAKPVIRQPLWHTGLLQAVKRLNNAAADELRALTHQYAGTEGAYLSTALRTTVQ